MVRSPWSDKKVSERAGHNSVPLPTTEGWREGDGIFPALTEPFMSLQGDRGEYNVENLKLSRRCHKSCKTQPEGKKLFFVFQ